MFLIEQLQSMRSYKTSIGIKLKILSAFARYKKYLLDSGYGAEKTLSFRKWLSSTKDVKQILLIRREISEDTLSQSCVSILPIYTDIKIL